jgi:hypothetical protein
VNEQSQGEINFNPPEQTNYNQGAQYQ